MPWRPTTSIAAGSDINQVLDLILDTPVIPAAGVILKDSRSMRALPVQPQPLWLIDFRQRIAASLWFVPTIFAVASIGAANLTVWLDARVGAPIGLRPDLVSDPSTAATFAGAIAAATLAFVAVVFATTLVAIQLAASQYSPRAVRVFIRSRITRVTLGLFLATFVFSLIVLVSNRASVASAAQFAPVVSVTTLLALSLATVFGFVAYLHGVVRLMRVQYLLETIATETRQAIEENFPPAAAYVDAEPPQPDPSPRRVCYTGTAGVITATDLHGLAELCQQNDCWLELTVVVGEYLAHGTPVALVHHGTCTTVRSPGSSSSAANAPSCKIRRSASGSSSTPRSARCLLPSTIRPPGYRPSIASATSWPSPVAGSIRPGCGWIRPGRCGSSVSCATSTACSCCP